MQLPQMIRVKQTFESPRVSSIPDEVASQLGSLSLDQSIQPGQTVAISAGSRGIANIAEIIKAACDHVKTLGAHPVIVPAMGSHGGGTAEGQRGIIESYGITEEFTGGEIRASMETVIVDETPQGIPVHFDKHASEADHVIVCGRIKPHTNFVGDIESGLHKMMLIGLGKHEGAKIYHRAIQDYSWLEIVMAVGESVLEKCSVVAGLAIVENAFDETAVIEAVRPSEFFEREKALLRQAKEWMPRLPFDEVDLLIVDEIGKNVSGSGMDTNVIGRKYNDHYAAEKEYPKITRIMVRDLTEETHGNACGIGLCEYAHKQAVDKMDNNITYINAMTGNHPSAAAVPIYFDSDREVIEAAIKTVGLAEPGQEKIVRIHDTLDLGEVMASEAYLAEVEKRDDLSLAGEPAEMEFDANGDLVAF